MADKRIIVVLCLLMVVALSLVNLLALPPIFGHKITGFAIFQPDSGKYNTSANENSAGGGILDYFINVGEPESPDSSYSSSDDVSATNNPSGGGSGGSNSGGQETISDECLKKYNLNSETIIFYYANELHSNAMKPLVQTLQSNFMFYWTDTLWDDEFNSCFGTSGVTPTFVCAGTREKLIGEVPKQTLEAFSQECQI